MSSHLIQSIDFDRHYDILKSTSIGIRYFSVNDEAGATIWQCGDDAFDLIDVNNIQQQYFDSDNKVSYADLDSENRIFTLDLYSFVGEIIGKLIFIIQAGVSLKKDASDREYTCWVNSVLRSVVNGMEKELQMIVEMDGMAKDLSERYDELNLVYDTEDQVSRYEEGELALEQLVRNCTDYLNVSGTVLYMPDKNIVLNSDKQTDIDDKLSDIYDFIRNDIYQWSLQTAGSGVFNAAHDYMKAGIDNYDNAKILSCPIFEANNKVIGVLACVNLGVSNLDITNSDRNLLETMARKVSKIIHSNYDSLTGLINRTCFEASLETALESTKKAKQVYSLLVIDLDQIQIINDVAGHTAGDNLIQEIGGLLPKVIRESDKLARLGGDVFGVMLQDCALDKAQNIAEKIRITISDYTYKWSDRVFDVSASIGMVEINEHTSSIAAVLSCAEIACEAAKEAGRNMVKIYHSLDIELVERKGHLNRVNQILQALREDRFVLYAQQIQSLTEEEDFHCEILIRMLDEQGNILAPRVFMPAAEQYVLMPKIDRWVVKNTLSYLAQYSSHLQGKKGHFAINISGQSIGQDGFADFLIDQVIGSCVSPAQICFEITESAAIRNLDMALNLIASLKDLGCYFSLDDFGTGLSSFTYLKELPVDFLKIDGSFVKGILEDPVSETMVKAIHQVGNVMGLKTIAEFVETDAIKVCLQDIGINYVQGYGIGKPMPVKDQMNNILTEEFRYAAQEN